MWCTASAWPEATANPLEKHERAMRAMLRYLKSQQVFINEPHDHVYATELFSNHSMRPAHDFIMAKHVARPDARGAVSLPGGTWSHL